MDIKVASVDTIAILYRSQEGQISTLATCDD